MDRVIKILFISLLVVLVIEFYGLLIFHESFSVFQKAMFCIAIITKASICIAICDPKSLRGPDY